jgi:hypothetical protein
MFTNFHYESYQIQNTSYIYMLGQIGGNYRDRHMHKHFVYFWKLLLTCSDQNKLVFPLVLWNRLCYDSDYNFMFHNTFNKEIFSNFFLLYLECSYC